MEKIKGYLGLAKNAGYLIIGSDKLKGYDKKLYLVLFDSLAGKSTLKIAEKLQERGVQVFKVEKISLLTGIENCKIIGLKNSGLSKEIKKYLI